MCDGIATELAGIDLGDTRLNERSRLIIEALSANPEASCNAACDGWSDTLGAYRFFKNKSVRPEDILKPHVEATKRRMREHSVALIAQDTTELDYSDHPPKDARCLNRETRLGLYDHTHLAVAPNGLSLGVVGVEYFDREEENLGKSKERSKLPIEEKESLRWLTGYRLACELARDCQETQIVSVADREADLYDIFMEAEKQAKEHSQSADFIIRAKIKRSTPERDPEAGPHAYRKVRDEVSKSELRATQTIDLPRTPKRAAREAKLEVRAIRVTVKPPHERSSLPTVTYNVVLVEEVDGPNDGTDVSWLLITSLPIDTLEDIQLVILNHGDETLRNTSLTLVMPNHAAFNIATELPLRPESGGFVERSPVERRDYPDVSLRDQAVQIAADLGDIEPEQPVAVFATPLRICADDELQGRRIGIQYTLTAHNLRAPAKGKLRLLF